LGVFARAALATETGDAAEAAVVALEPPSFRWRLRAASAMAGGGRCG
jgi:hypothetical protein